MARRRLRSRLSGTVPISIGVHLAVLLVILIIPLTATLDLPDPAAHLPDYMLAAPLPPPPPAPRVSAPGASRVISPGPVTPTKAPETIEPESAPPAAALVPDIGPATAGVPDSGGVMSGGTPLPSPPEPPRQVAPIRVADLPVSPRKIVDVRPLYPDLARTARVEGTIIMEAVLDVSGRVTQVRLLQSVPLLDQAALDAVRQWRYTPSSYGGHAVSVLMTITVRFTLQ